MASLRDQGKRLEAASMDPTALVVIGHDTKDGPEHPLYDERASLPLDERMVNSIMLQGVLEPVRARKNKKTGAWEVTAGRQRVKNAREANKRLKKEGKEPKLVPVLPYAEGDLETMEASIAENEIREGDTLTIKAAKLERYLATEGATEEKAAVVFGVTLQSIRNWRKIGDLDSSVIKAIESGKVKASAAWNLASLPKADQKAELEKQLSSGKVTAKKTQKAAKKSRTGEENYAPGKRVINRVLKLNKKSGDVLPSDFVRGVLWVLGDTNPATVGGLTKLIREATGEE